jgi:hypothetical protein
MITPKTKAGIVIKKSVIDIPGIVNARGIARGIKIRRNSAKK